MSAVVGWLVFVFIRSWKETEGAGSCILVFWGKGQGNSRMGCECLVGMLREYASISSLQPSCPPGAALTKHGEHDLKTALLWVVVLSG